MSNDATWPSASGETIDFVVISAQDGREWIVDYKTDPPTTRQIGGWQVHISHEGGAFEVLDGAPPSTNA